MGREEGNDHGLFSGVVPRDALKICKVVYMGNFIDMASGAYSGLVW